MYSQGRFQKPEDAGLWLLAAGLSLIANIGLLIFGGMAVLEYRKIQPQPSAAAKNSEAVIYLEPIEPSSAAPVLTPPQKRFARTSPDQAAPPLKKPAFMGERDTRATSEKAPSPDAPPLPSQAGIQPRDESDIETTESDYQDGELQTETAPVREVSEARPAVTAPAEKPRNVPIGEAPPPVREKWLDGPTPVDVMVPREVKAVEKIEPIPAKQAPFVKESATITEPQKPTPATAAAPAKPAKPAFSGFQRKTAVVGSISRTGRSALDVEDSPLGRYQAAVSRAVELEWQRNCVRHRDFITPGFLTVRFFVESSGRVRSVQFAGDMETGEVQKGFTLNAIRDAAIPAMPKALRREYDEEPLELIFRFYF